MDGVTYYTALPEGHCDQYEMVMSTDFEAACDERDAALAREAALREQCGGMQMSLDEAAEREAALREELADARLCRSVSEGEWMEALTAAEQRNSGLVELLRAINAKASKSHTSQSLWQLKTDMANIAQVTDAAIKPTESGAS